MFGIVLTAARWCGHDAVMQLNPSALRVIRERTGYSQTELAELTGIDRSALSNMEAGRRKGTPAQLRELATVLQVPITALYGPAPAEIGADR